MRHKIAAAVGVSAAILTAGFWVSAHVEDGRDLSERPLEPEPSHATAAEVPSGVAESSGVPRSSGVPLRELSPTFRHSTFLVAIRDAGFYCDDVIDAKETGEGIWIADCTDARAYLLRARPTDTLSVEPILYDAPRSSPPVRPELPR